MNVMLSRITDPPTPLDTIRRQHCLDDILDARLIADPRVVDFHRSASEDSILSCAGAPPGSTSRTVRTAHRILVIVAIPDGTTGATISRRSSYSRRDIKNLLIIPERYLRRRPYVDGAMLIAESAGCPVSPLARVLISNHLSESGGSSELGDCAAYVNAARDPVQAVLALAAAKAIAIDISRPITARTRVHLPAS